MIFLDTSAIYALADSRDLSHHDAIQRLQGILGRGEELLTHNYVVLESVSLLQARLGLSAASKFAKESTAFVIEWVDEELHASSIRALEKSGKRSISLVDHISFLVMKRRSVTTAFAFDPDFKAEGFGLFEL